MGLASNTSALAVELGVRFRRQGLGEAVSQHLGRRAVLNLDDAVVLPLAKLVEGGVDVEGSMF